MPVKCIIRVAEMYSHDLSILLYGNVRIGLSRMRARLHAECACTGHDSVRRSERRSGDLHPLISTVTEMVSANSPKKIWELSVYVYQRYKGYEIVTYSDLPQAVHGPRQIYRPTHLNA